MKFRINTKQFNQAVAPAADVALKKVLRDNDEENGVFYCAHMLTIEASSTVLNIRAYGGCASITVKVRDTEGYVCEDGGVVTIKAKELIDALKSFSPMANLSVCKENYQLKLSLESDHKVFVELPIININIECPRLPKIFEQKTVVDRMCFVKGLKKVAYAMATEEKMFTYMCLLFESWKNRMRFTAGSGARFAIFEIADYRQIISTDEVKILFPKQNVGNIIRAFNNIGGSTMQVKTAEVDSRNGVYEQLVLENDSVTLALYGLECYTKYPDMNELLNRNYPYQISTSAKDWGQIGKAIHATRSGHDKIIHNTRITADLLHGYFNIRTNTKKQLKKRVDFELGRLVADTSKDKTYQPWICCNSNHMEEFARKGYKDGIMTLHFEDQAKLAEIPEDKPKQMKPVIVTYPERTNRDGTVEKYAVLFTVSTKW